MKPLVILCNRNRGSNIATVLWSLVYQTYTDFQVIFMDSNSTDNSLEVANYFTDKLDLIVHERKSVRSRNVGALKDCITIYGDKQQPSDIIIMNGSEIAFADNAVNWFINIDPQREFRFPRWLTIKKSETSIINGLVSANPSSVGKVLQSFNNIHRSSIGSSWLGSTRRVTWDKLKVPEFPRYGNHGWFTLHTKNFAKEFSEEILMYHLWHVIDANPYKCYY